MVTVKKLHLIWGFVLAVATPCIAGTAAYYKSMNELAPREQVEKLTDKVNQMAEDVAEIKGILKGQRRP